MHRHFIRANWIALGIGLLLPIVGPPPAAAQAISETQVKAAYLYNFAKFVNWPDGTFATAQDSIRLCVLRDESFQGQLDQIVKGKNIAGHPVLVIGIQSGQQARRCHELFIGSAQDQDTGQILESLKVAGVLTIGEGRGFMEAGGIIGFIMQGNHVRFQVNQKAANQARLRLSSQLLSVAQAVIE
jgi:hypothetical protein